jgi:hypothetical protein
LDNSDPADNPASSLVSAATATDEQITEPVAKRSAHCHEPHCWHVSADFQLARGQTPGELWKMTTSKRTTQRTRRPRIKRERSQSKRLLSPTRNYFGAAPETGLKAAGEAAGNTKYEELGCIGFEPEKGLSASYLTKKHEGGGVSIASLYQPTKRILFKRFRQYRSGVCPPVPRLDNSDNGGLSEQL